MFGLSWIYATATVICQVSPTPHPLTWPDDVLLYCQTILGAYIYYRAPATNWGSSAVSHTFNTAIQGVREVSEEDMIN